MLPKNYTTFATLARGLNQGAVLDAIIINTFISHVISIMFPISSQVFPKTHAVKIASTYYILHTKYYTYISILIYAPDWY